jgi:hypothetical protein
VIRTIQPPSVNFIVEEQSPGSSAQFLQAVANETVSAAALLPLYFFAFNLRTFAELVET